MKEEQNIYSNSQILELARGLSSDPQWVERCKKMTLNDAIEILREIGFSLEKIKDKTK